jgi:hypothetical protein
LGNLVIEEATNRSAAIGVSESPDRRITND